MSDRFGDTTELQLNSIAEAPADGSTLQHQMENFEDDLVNFDGQAEPGSVAFP